MKKQFLSILIVVLLALAGQRAHSAVIVSNLDPDNPAFGENSTQIGQAMLTGNRPISLTSVMFLQTGGPGTGETAAVYSRNADGTLGTSLFAGFTVGFNTASQVTTASVTVPGSFTLQANSGYYFVLTTGNVATIEWSFTSSTDYASAFGASVPATNTSFFVAGGTQVYRSLAQGPQEFQVNGSGLPAVPEPSAVVLLGLTVVGGAAVLARRRSAKA